MRTHHDSIDDVKRDYKEEKFVEFTVYTFFQPPDGGPIMRADMPIDVLRIDHDDFNKPITRRKL